MKIIIDVRENNLYDRCVAMKTTEKNTIEKNVLLIGDIVIKSNDDKEMCIIERKSLQDLLSSIKDGRYKEQSHRLIHTSGICTHNIIYIIEGMMSTIQSDKDKKIIYSAITSLNFYKGFSVLRTSSCQETADLIMYMAEKMETNESKNIKMWNDITTNIPSYTSVVKKVKKENVTPENITEIILCQIPGVSSVISENIVKKYNSLGKLLDAFKENPDCLNNMTYILKDKERKINSTALKNIQNYLSP
jgi:crossover junction endonuclease MUS81